MKHTKLIMLIGIIGLIILSVVSCLLFIENNSLKSKNKEFIDKLIKILPMNPYDRVTAVCNFKYVYVEHLFNNSTYLFENLKTMDLIES